MKTIYLIDENSEGKVGTTIMQTVTRCIIKACARVHIYTGVVARARTALQPGGGCRPMCAHMSTSPSSFPRNSTVRIYVYVHKLTREVAFAQIAHWQTRHAALKLCACALLYLLRRLLREVEREKERARIITNGGGDAGIRRISTHI